MMGSSRIRITQRVGFSRFLPAAHSARHLHFCIIGPCRKPSNRPKDACNACDACTKLCPMDIRISDYITQGQRVLSTECIMCRTCVSACPENALGFSGAWDIGHHGKLARKK
jgi:ferredoxin